MNPEPSDRIVQFNQLNLLGKAVFLGGAAVRVGANLIDAALERAVDVVLDAERAFQDGLNPKYEDAKILEEYEERRPAPMPDRFDLG